MRVRTSFQIVLMVLLAVGLTRCKQSSEQPAETPTTTETVAPPVEGDVSMAAITEQIQGYKTHLRKMRRTVREGKTQEGSLELNEATHLLLEHVTMASGDVQEYLQYSIDEFTGLSERVFTPSSLGPYDIDTAVTHALWAELLYHFGQASAWWANNEGPATVVYLTASASYLDESIGYQAGGLEVKSEALVTQIRNLARELETGAISDRASVTAEIDDIGNKIRAYNKLVREAIETNL